MTKIKIKQLKKELTLLEDFSKKTEVKEDELIRWVSNCATFFLN